MAISLVVFIGAGLALGWGNARFTELSATRVPGVRALTLLSAARLLVLTGVTVGAAFFFQPAGVGILLGLAAFQAVTLLRVARPILRGRT
ncbi:hypothetical protein [Nocardia sp. NPDC048505]|uniref:hypothetical protein n=1 Tax=unclassified Nocardia TaxID=2637762 RepID=UPI0033EE64C8